MTPFDHLSEDNHINCPLRARPITASNLYTKHVLFAPDGSVKNLWLFLRSGLLALPSEIDALAVRPSETPFQIEVTLQSPRSMLFFLASSHRDPGHDRENGSTGGEQEDHRNDYQQHAFTYLAARRAGKGKPATGISAVVSTSGHLPSGRVVPQGALANLAVECASEHRPVR